MAPMEPAKEAQFTPPPKEDLEKALADSKVDDLKEMARRLAKSHENLNVMLEDLQVEKQSLKEENEELQQTIDRFMKELQKLNIGADNTVEPQLAEDPLIFVNRMWEKLKPRDTAVVVSEHVGEIKKPVPEDEASPDHREKVRQVVDNVTSAIGPLWQRGLGAWSNLQQKLAEQREPPAPKKQPRKRKEQRASEGGQGYAADAPPAAPADVPKVVEEKPPQSSSSSTAASSTASATTAEAEKAPAAPTEEDEAAKEEAAKKAAEEQISSTILIEAELTLEDGSTETLQVRAADRCKEVAKNFIQEHSLKAWFTEPLTKWLKQVESDAVKFPVQVKGDLMEIRKQHGRSA